MRQKYTAKSCIKQEDAQNVGEFIYEKCQGKTTSEILEIIKKNKDHVINQYIDWNDKTASEKYRLNQVMNIIHSIEIEVVSVGSKEPRQVRCFFPVNTSTTSEDKVWKPIEVVMTNEFERNQVISRAKNELEGWTERYESYTELASVIKPIKKFLKR